MEEKTGVVVAESQALEEYQEPEDIYVGLSMSKFDEGQIKILTDPVTAEEVEILPTGELYLSQVNYRRRLTRAFGPGGWALKPISKPTMKAALLMQEYALYVEGRFIASAYGEGTYQDNGRMTYGDVLETVKSNALMRCCKDMSIAAECWDKRFINTFRAEHCIQVRVESTPKPQWRRNDQPPFWNEVGPFKPKQGGAQPVRPMTKPVEVKAEPPKELHDDDLAGLIEPETLSMPIVSPQPAEQSRVVIEEVRVVEPIQPRLYDIERLHYKDEADPATGEIVTYVSIAGAWFPATKQIKPKSANRLEKLFADENGKINDYEVKGSIKKHFGFTATGKGPQTIYELNYEEAAALYRWKKEGEADPRWYADKIKMEVDTDKIAQIADQFYYADTWDENARLRFIENLGSLDDPMQLTEMFARGWTIESNRDDFLSLSGLLASGVLVWGDEAFEDTVKSVNKQ